MLYGSDPMNDTFERPHDFRHIHRIFVVFEMLLVDFARTFNFCHLYEPEPRVV